MSKPLEIKYDEAKDLLTIEGRDYAGNLFRRLEDEEPVMWAFAIKEKDGIVCPFCRHKIVTAKEGGDLPNPV